MIWAPHTFCRSFHLWATSLIDALPLISDVHPRKCPPYLRQRWEHCSLALVYPEKSFKKTQMAHVGVRSKAKQTSPVQNCRLGCLDVARLNLSCLLKCAFARESSGRSCTRYLIRILCFILLYSWWGWYDEWLSSFVFVHCVGKKRISNRFSLLFTLFSL